MRQYVLYSADAASNDSYGVDPESLDQLSSKIQAYLGERARVYFRGQIITSRPQTLQVL